MLTTSRGSYPRIRTKPPSNEGATLSACAAPQAIRSASIANGRRSFFSNGLPINSLIPTSAATELAALEPIPLPRGSCFFNTMSTPWSLLMDFRNSRTATPAVFLSGASGSRPPSPSILRIRTPGLSLRVKVTSSPGLSTANPKTSNPHETLATVAGANARRVLISTCIMANPDDIRKHSSCRNCSTSPRPADNHWPVVVSLRRQKDNVVTSRQRIERMLLIHTAKSDADFPVFQYRHVTQFFLLRLRASAELLE